MLATELFRSVMVVAPHADDEVLGAGGLLAKLAKHGVAVRVVYLAVDGFHHYGLDRSTTLSERKAEILEVASLLNFDFRIVYEGRDLIEKLDILPQRELVDIFEHEYNAFRPDLVLVPHGVDFDQDHVACFRAAFAAARPISRDLKYFPTKIVSYEMPKLTWSASPFAPSLYFDITDEIETKLRGIAAYRTQLRDPPHIRSLETIQALAKLRGAEIGVPFGEAFHVLRWVIEPVPQSWL